MDWKPLQRERESENSTAFILGLSSMLLTAKNVQHIGDRVVCRGLDLKQTAEVSRLQLLWKRGCLGEAFCHSWSWKLFQPGCPLWHNGKSCRIDFSDVQHRVIWLAVWHHNVIVPSPQCLPLPIPEKNACQEAHISRGRDVCKNHSLPSFSSSWLSAHLTHKTDQFFLAESSACSTWR